MSKRITKWELASYSRMSGEFTTLPGSYDTPEAACAAVGKKAWVHDHKIQEHVLYDPAKHGDAVRVDCGNTALEAYNHWTAAFRKECSELSLAWHSSERESAAVTSGEKVVLLTGNRIQIHANQDVEWTMSGLNWGEFGKGKRSAVLVSYKPNDTVSLTVTTKCGETKTLTFVFQAREYDDSKAYNGSNAPMLEQIKKLIANIWGKEFAEKIDISQITPEIVDLVQEAANEIVYRSQGMLMMDIVFNFLLTGIPNLAQLIFSVATTTATDYFANEINGLKPKDLRGEKERQNQKEKLEVARNAFATYEGWFNVYKGKKAHRSVINTVALKYQPELVALLASQ